MARQIMHCLFAHRWILGEVFDVQSFSPWRKCTRCGVVQRGVYDAVREDITWETMRDRSYDQSLHRQIVRRRTSGLDQLAHSFGLRRSRIGDRSGPANGSP